MVIKCPQWAKVLRNCTEAAWGGMTTPLRNLIWKMPGVQIIIYVSIIQVLVWLALFSGRRRETPGNLHEFKLFHYLKVGSTNQIEKHCHMT